MTHIDFTALKATRRESVAKAVELWGSTAIRPRPNPRLLISADGRVDDKRVDELILRRDNRPVTIKE